LIFLQIPLNSNQYLNPTIFFFSFFLKKRRGILKILTGFNEKF